MLNLDHLTHIKAIAAADHRYAKFTELPAVDMRRMIRSLPLAKHCQHLGPTLSHAEAKKHHGKLLELGVLCNSCSGERSEYHCAKFDFTNMGKCTACRKWEPNQSIYARPGIRLDHDSLFPDIPGDRLNCSIIPSGDGYLFSWRQGWGGSDIYACRLSSEFAVDSKPALLGLTRQGAEFGREDARLFRVGSALYLMYIGVERKFGPVNVLYARINESTLKVMRKWHPLIPKRQEWEKNHAYFEYDKKIYAVYSIKPHQVMRIDGNDVQLLPSTRPRLSWSGGRLSGGASPVLHGNEYYHFFHGSTEWNGRRQYNIGVYTFEAKSPFRIKRFTPHPIDVADPTVSHDNHCDVLFPGGSFWKDKMWVVAMGVHDRWCEIRFYHQSWIESQLQEL